MGIFSKLFNRGKSKSTLSNDDVYTNPFYNDQNQVNNDKKSTLKLEEYKSGIVCEVEFLNPKDIMDKNGNLFKIQEVEVTYTEDHGKGRFMKKIVALDPKMIKDQTGNNVCITEQYYKNLAIQNMSLVKGFFLKDDVNKIENGYIGYIGTDMKGQYNRSFNPIVKAYYDEQLRVRKNQREAYETSENEKFQEELREKIKNIKPNIKPDHAEVLRSYQAYGDRYQKPKNDDPTI